MEVERIDERSGWFTVIGKNDKERVCHLPPDAVRALSRWLRLRTVRSAWVFPRRRLDGSFDGTKHMSGQGVLHALREIAKRAHVEAQFSAHDFRRTFVTRLIESGADLALVRDLAGHENVETTANYDRRVEHTRHAAVESITLPLLPGWDA
jgi:integrase